MSRISSLMRNKAILQRRVVIGEDDYCGPVFDWEDVTELRCSVEPLKGQEFFGGVSAGNLPQRVAEVDSRIRIRYRRDLNPAEHRIVYGGVAYDLVAVIHDRKRGQTQLMVKASAIQQADGSTVNE